MEEPKYWPTSDFTCKRELVADSAELKLTDLGTDIGWRNTNVFDIDLLSLLLLNQ